MKRQEKQPGKASELRQRAEERLGREGATGGPPADEDTARLVHELRVHQIELESQNEELRAAQMALDALRARFFDLFDLAPVGYCIVGEKGLILEANVTAATLLGVSRGALVKQPLTRFVLGEDQDIFYRLRRQLFATGAPQTCDLRMRREDGTSFWARLEAAAARGDDGAPVCRLTMSDSSERMQAQSALRESEERLRLALKATNDVVWDWDVVSDAQRWNESGAAVFGWTDIVAAPQTAAWWVERVHPEDRQRVEEGFFAVVNDPASERWADEYRFRRADGSYAQVADRGHVLRDSAGRAVRMIGAMLDVTEQKEAEARLRLQAQVLDQIQDRVTVTDLDGVITYVNDAQARALGCAREELLGGTPEIFGEDPGRGATQRQILEATRRDGCWRGEVVNFAADGREAILDCRTQAVLDEQGRRAAFCGIATDITERKRAELDLRRTTELLDSVRKAQSQIIAQGDPHPVFDALLQTLVNLTESEFGFLDEVLYEPDGTPYKRSLAMSNISWDPGFRALYERLHGHDPELLKSSDPAGLPAARREAVIANDVARDPRAGGLPPGHPAIRSFMGLPVRAGGRVVGVVGVANRRGGYDEETARFLEPYLSACAGIIEAIRLHARERETVAALRRSEEKYRLLVDTASEGIWSMDAGHVTTYVNQAMADMLGYPISEVLGRKVEEFLFPEDLAFHGERMRQRHAGLDEKYERRFRRRDGSTLWVLGSARALKDEQGRFAGSFALFGDITERRRAEEALAASRDLLRSVLESAPVRVFWKDARLRYLGCNSAFARDAGVSCPEELVGKDDFQMGWREQAERYRADDRQVMESGRPKLGYEEPQTTPAGGSIWLRSSKVPLRDPQGEVLGVLGVYEDITEQKRAAEERQKLQAQLTQAQKMESVGRLAGGVAHDFNNMLGVILGHTEMALAQVDPAQSLHDQLREIRAAAERSAELTRQLLAFARKQTVSPRVLDVNETVAGMLRMLQRLIGEDIDLAWLPGRDPGPVRMDPSQIDQILANLCVNARDAIAGVGRVAIETGAAVLDEAFCAGQAGVVPGEYVLLAVSDNGCGMGPETLAQLFEPFFTTKETGKGTGLGLATVYGVVKQNRGFIDVASEPGRGTTFRVYLPRHVDESASMTVDHTVKPARGKETVLLVEDEPAMLRMTRSMLEGQGYAVLAARTPGEALRLAREHGGEIQLLLTDVVMPEMNGRDLAGELQSLHPGLKCLFMSGYTADVIAHHGVLDEGMHFVQKPFSTSELAARVREAIGPAGEK